MVNLKSADQCILGNSSTGRVHAPNIFIRSSAVAPEDHFRKTILCLKRQDTELYFSNYSWVIVKSMHYNYVTCRQRGPLSYPNPNFNPSFDLLTRGLMHAKGHTRTLNTTIVSRQCELQTTSHISTCGISLFRISQNLT